jgi:hypothetical protein
MVDGVSVMGIPPFEVQDYPGLKKIFSHKWPQMDTNDSPSEENIGKGFNRGERGSRLRRNVI